MQKMKINTKEHERLSDKAFLRPDGVLVSYGAKETVKGKEIKEVKKWDISRCELAEFKASLVSCDPGVYNSISRASRINSYMISSAGGCMLAVASAAGGYALGTTGYELPAAIFTGMLGLYTGLLLQPTIAKRLEDSKVKSLMKLVRKR